MGLCADGVDGAGGKIRGGRLAGGHRRTSSPEGIRSSVQRTSTATYDRLKNGATMIQYVRRSIAATGSFAGMEPIGDAREGGRRRGGVEQGLRVMVWPGRRLPGEPGPRMGNRRADRVPARTRGVRASADDRR